jgi:hypothetical protein
MRSKRSSTRQREHIFSDDRQNYFNAEGEAAMVISKNVLIALIEHCVLTEAQLIDGIDSAIAAKRQSVEEGQDVEVSRIAAGLVAVSA